MALYGNHPRCETRDCDAYMSDNRFFFFSDAELEDLYQGVKGKNEKLEKEILNSLKESEDMTRDKIRCMIADEGEDDTETT
jgi:hypothetical protein